MARQIPEKIKSYADALNIFAQGRSLLPSLVIIVYLSLVGIAAPAHAACMPSLPEATDLLRRLQRTSDLDGALRLSRRAGNELEDAAMQASSCCPGAYIDLDSASTSLRRASRQDSARDFESYLKRALREYNDAVDIINAGQCGARR